MQNRVGLKVVSQEPDAASQASGAAESLEGESWQRIVVVSNRLPFKVELNSARKPSVVASSGGLVTAMTPLLHRGIAGKWVGWPGTDEEEGLDEALRSESAGQFDIGIVTLTPDEEQGYYQGYANEVLAPLLVGETGRVDLDKARKYWPVYQNVQRKFADVICEDLGARDIIWVHDYHLTGVGRKLRARGVVQPVGFFLHTPFPSKETFRIVPQHGQLLRDMLAYDIVGFQTKLFEDNFVGAVQEFVPETRVIAESGGARKLSYRGHTTRLGHFPISIDVGEFEHQLYAADTHRNIRRLRAVFRPERGQQLIFNAGRQDYSKGFLEELIAFDLLLSRQPELVGKVILLQLIIPSRAGITAYREYQDKIEALAREINHRYGRKVVRQAYTHMSRARYLAHLHVADVQSVPTLSDGMNLVAKESAIVGNPMTVLLLGQNAGASEELGQYALLIDPEDVQAFAAELYRALAMRESEKRRRKSGLKSAVTANDVFGWWSDKQEPLFQKVWDEKRTA